MNDQEIIAQHKALKKEAEKRNLALGEMLKKIKEENPPPAILVIDKKTKEEVTIPLDVFTKYIEGWAWEKEVKNYTIEEFKAILHNSLNCIDCKNDGIEAYKERQEHYNTTKKQT